MEIKTWDNFFPGELHKLQLVKNSTTQMDQLFSKNGLEQMKSNKGVLVATDKNNQPIIGISGTVTLAKITPGGTTGSIVFVNGTVTAVTLPT